MATQETQVKYGAVILAAGYSSRMGAFKPLMPLPDTRPVIDRVIEVARAAGLSPLVVVTGHNQEALQEHLHRDPPNDPKRGSITLAYNEHFDRGMFTSIQTGIRALCREEAVAPAGCFLLPVDCPAVEAATICEMVRRLEESDCDDLFVVPTFRGKKGHPLYVPGRYWQEIADHDGENGLKGVTESYPDAMLRIPVEDEGILLDMDDPAGYEEVCAYLRGRGKAGKTLLELAAGRRFVLIRHGQIRQHREKIFLGQTDVPLGETGCRQAQMAGAALARHWRAVAGERPKHIYTSPLMRAKETARIIAAEIEDGSLSIEALPDLQEMSLGEWDGKYIRDIRERYPEEFERRGRELFSFKLGNHSENFYDLQYRVVRALKGILLTDPAEEIVIVSHQGVLRVIETNLKGGGVEDDWEPMENGQIRILPVV